AASARVTIFDRAGRIVDTAGPAGYFRDIALSPDDAHLLVGSSSGVARLMEVGKSGELPLSSEVFWSRWSVGPKGVKIVGIRRASREFVDTTADSSGQVRVIAPVPLGLSGEMGFVWSDLSADGSKALFIMVTPTMPPTSRPAILCVPVKAAPAEPVVLLK